MSRAGEGRSAEELLEAGLEELGIEPAGELIDAFMIHIREIELWNGKVRLVSYPEPKTIVLRHLLDSLAAQRLVEDLLREIGAGAAARGEAGRIADVGSGGGFPGIPLALLYPELELLLVERKTKKAAFLRSLVGLLGLRARVDVLEGDVQEVSSAFPLVLCRAFRPISEAFGLLRPLLWEGGGKILIYGGTRAQIEAELELLRSETVDVDVRFFPLRVPFLNEERNAVLFEL